MLCSKSQGALHPIQRIMWASQAHRVSIVAFVVVGRALKPERFPEAPPSGIPGGESSKLCVRLNMFVSATTWSSEVCVEVGMEVCMEVCIMMEVWPTHGDTAVPS